VFASDALSSVAYATEEVLLVLVVMGAAGFYQLVPISLWLGVLLVIVGFSYYQTIHAYPQGGGTYLVSTENLGSLAGRCAGAALLIDYILTVAVSISSAVSFVISAFPAVKPYAVLVACSAIAILAIANLRGAKESGIVFAIPTYSFVVAVLVMLAVGVWKATVGGVGPFAPEFHAGSEPFHAVTAFLMLRAFAASCTALTGTEAIADGVQAFRPPEAKNASQTLAMMVGLLLVMFIGVSWCAQHYGIVPMHVNQPGYQTVLVQLADRIFDHWQGYLYLISAVTAVILFLAANTAFADFPRLSSFIARDGYLPRQLMSLGDRLVFQNGIVLLALLAIALVVIYDADTHALVPLYALGVFISFTLSQSGMVARWLRTDAHPWRNYRIYISLVGAVATFIVAIILGWTKFSEGAWLIFVAMGLLLFVFARIKRHYVYLAKELSITPDDTLPSVQTKVLLLVPRVHKGIIQAIAYAKAIGHDCRAIHVTLDPSSTEQVKADWNRFGAGIPLVILESPYRSLVEPIIEYVDQALAEDPSVMLTVIVPQAVPKYWWQGLLHTNAAVPLKLALGARKNLVVTNVRYFLK